MPELYEKQAFRVEEDEELGWEGPSIIEEEGSQELVPDKDEQFVIDEVEELELVPDEQFVIDESEIELDEVDFAEDSCLVPGSDIDFVDDEMSSEKETDWEHDKDYSKFVPHVKNKLKKIPRHSGEKVDGCERAKSYLKSLLNEISKAMRSDFDGIIDEQEVDSLRKDIDEKIDRLDLQIKKLTGKKASLDVRLFSEGQCNKCGSTAPMWHNVENNNLVCMHCEAELSKTDVMEKTAGTAKLNVYVSAFERAVVGTIINSKVSAGRNITETYQKLKNKYNFTPREELAIQQLVADYGYPVFLDRGRINEDSDPASSGSVDWQTHYYA